MNRKILDNIVGCSIVVLLIFLPLRELLATYLGNYIKLFSDIIVIGLFLAGLITKKIK